jgi:outer membrane protein assembly factor BamE
MDPMTLRFRIAFALRVATLVGTLSIASGCTPYKMEVQQGNFISQEMVSQLKQGMTRDQVRFVLGSPLVVDPFREDRWDYVYTRTPANSSKTETRRLSVIFANDVLARVEGDIAAAGATAPATQN